jgi:16S rRNA (cytosine967-C5)-methyltransferase
VQDEGSQLLALLLDAKRGEMVVDFCAGAGGKTLAIGATMRSTGRLYAFDVSAHRLDALKPRLARSGLSNVHPAAIAHERDERIKRLAGKIDRVLVDAPCSGLGTLRRNPDLKWRQSPKGVQSWWPSRRHSGQRSAPAQAGRAAGVCHLQHAAAGKRGHCRGLQCRPPGFRAADAGELLSAEGGGRRQPVQRRCLEGTGYLRLWPHRHHTDGFFAAVWKQGV